MSEDHLSSRQPISETEAAVLKDLQRSWRCLHMDAMDERILQGNLDLCSIGVENPLLMYEVGGGDDTDTRSAKVVPILQIDEKILDELHQDGEPSHFGRGNELVRDESYRLAREIRADRFGLNFDPLADETGILGAVSREISILDCVEVEAKLYKLNSYVTGGHFKLHQDTPRRRDHIGTLLIGLPTRYSGGKLLLKSYKFERGIDWSIDGRKNLRKTDIPWVFFYGDIEHEILSVTSGHRVTIAYDIYHSHIQKLIPSPLNAKLDVSSRPIFHDLKSKVLESKDFRPNGGRLAFPSNHEYPMPLVRLSAHLTDMLRGGDQILVYAARQFGIPVSTKAVYKCVDGSRYDENSTSMETTWLPPDIPESIFNFKTNSEDALSERYPVDDYSSYDPRTGVNRFTSDGFGDGLPESICVNPEEPQKFQLLLEHCDLELEMDLIWVDVPRRFTKTSTFASYGNEPSGDHTYVSAVTILEIPPYGSGCRAEHETND